MYLNKKVFIKIWVFIIFICPHFPYYSYSLARVMDALTLLLLVIPIIIYSREMKITKDIHFLLVILITVSVSIVLGNSNGIKLSEQSLSNLADLYRPLLWMVSVIFGVMLHKIKFKKQELINIMLMIGLFSLSIAIFEKIGFKFLYTIYSGGLHIVSNRATGIAQDFGDYAMLHWLCSVLSLIQYRELKKVFYLFLSVLFSFSIILSTSKAGMGIIACNLFIILKYVIFSRETRFAIRFVALCVLILIATYAVYFVFKDEKFLREIKALISFSVNLPSIKNRLDDFYVVKETLYSPFSIDAIIGIGANKLNEDAYIEVAFLSNLYRLGILGTFFYYLIFVYISFLFFKNERSIMWLILAAIVIDVVAAMTNRLLGISMLFIYLGFMCSNRNGGHFVKMKLKQLKVYKHMSF